MNDSVRRRTTDMEPWEKELHDSMLEIELRKVDEETARNVLFYFGDRENGWEAGSFTTQLMSAIARADELNKQRLSLGFPALVAGMRIAQEWIGGMDALREAAGIRAALKQSGLET